MTYFLSVGCLTSFQTKRIENKLFQSIPISERNKKESLTLIFLGSYLSILSFLWFNFKSMKFRIKDFWMNETWVFYVLGFSCWKLLLGLSWDFVLWSSSFSSKSSIQSDGRIIVFTGLVRGGYDELCWYL